MRLPPSTQRLTPSIAHDTPVGRVAPGATSPPGDGSTTSTQTELAPRTLAPRTSGSTPPVGTDLSAGTGRGARDTAAAGLVREALAGWGRLDAATLRAHTRGVAEALYQPKGAANQAFDAVGRVAHGVDVEAIARAPVFSMYLSGPGAADALVAAGVALAHDVPSIYLCHSRKDLPWFLREADQSHPGRVQILEAATVDGLASALHALEPSTFTRAPAAADAPPLHTFIGCLMTGLSEAQYTEGRAQLLAIHTTLSERLGSPNNHCEGIMVASTSSFGTPKESLLMDERAIRGAERCIFYQYDDASRPSGMWVEAGIALGLGKPSTFLVPNLGGTPPGLSALAGPSVELVTYGDHAALATLLAERPAALLPSGA